MPDWKPSVCILCECNCGVEASQGYTCEKALRLDHYAFVLAAGERRSFTANTIFRNPDWRKWDCEGALRMSPADAAELGVADGGRVRVTTRRGTVETVVEVSDTVQASHVTMPTASVSTIPGPPGRSSPAPPPTS